MMTNLHHDAAHCDSVCVDERLKVEKTYEKFSMDVVDVNLSGSTTANRVARPDIGGTIQDHGVVPS